MTLFSKLIFVLARLSVLSIILVFSACSMKSQLDEIISTSVDASRSKIVVPDPAQGVADGESTVPVHVYAINDEGSPLKGFIPELAVFGQGDHVINCEPVREEYATCTLSATKGGDKLIVTKNALILEPGRVFFAEDSSTGLMVVKKHQVPANGVTKALIEVQLKNALGTGRSGVRPELYVEGEQSVNIQCSVTGSSGVSQCHLTASAPGVYSVKSSSPALLPVEVEFVDAKLKIIEGRAFAGVTNSVAKVQVVTSSLPTLVSQPNDVTISCAAVSNGKSLCTLSSSNIGTKVIRVTSPTNIDEAVEVHFAGTHNNASIVPGQSPKADGTKEVEIEVVVKDKDGNPLSGVIPVAEVNGPGQSAIRCEASDAEGKAKCYVSSTEPGEKKVTIKEPLVKDIVTVDFGASPVVKESDRMPADGSSPAVIEISTGNKEGIIPELEIKGPNGSKAEYFCAPSSKAPGESEAKSVCYISAKDSGNYNVKVQSPVQAEVPLTFTDTKSSMKLAGGDDGQAKADNLEKIYVVVKIKNSLGMPRIGMTPTLAVSPSSGVSVSCSGAGMTGEATCELKSNKAGNYYVRSNDPILTEELIVVFTNPFGGIAADNVGAGIISEPSAVTDPSSKSVIYVEMKDSTGNPVEGSVPVLNVEGSGTNSYICYPSNTDGLARCEITATEAGTKTVHIVSPPMDQTVTLDIRSNVRSCTAAFAADTQQTWIGPNLEQWGTCTILGCELNYTLTSNVCQPNVRSCSPMPVGAGVGTQTWDSRNTDKTWGHCTIASCLANYTLTPSNPEENNSCVADSRTCPSTDLLANFHAGTQTWNGQDWGVCKATICNYPYKVENQACATADTEPTLTGLMVDVANAMPNQVYTSNVFAISDLERSVPITLSGGIDAYIETRRSPGTWVNRGRSVAPEALVDAQEGIQNGDEIRIVAKSSGELTAVSTMSLYVGSASAVSWSITTTSALPPSAPVLTHTPNMKAFQISWGTGGLGNGGADQCLLQYFKNPSWVNIGSTYNCDQAQSTVTVNLPADEWVGSFNSDGVPVRLVRLTDNSTVLTFTNKLTCVADAMMPFDNDPNKDENCNALWADEDDKEAPLGGSFAIAATDVGNSSVTGSVNVNLNITCPNDQANGIKVAFGNDASPNNFEDCEATKIHTLVAGSGEKTVHVRFKDGYGNTTADLQQAITLDQSAPVGGGLTINNGAAKTHLLAVDLNITCPSDSNGPLEMAIGSSATPSTWEACVTAKAYNLNIGDGAQTVFARFRDKFGNTSADTTASIILDQTGAISSLSYTNGWVNSLSLALSVSASDALNSNPLVCSIEAQEASLSGASVGTYGAFNQVSNSCVDTSYTLVHGKAYRLRVKATDSLGNIGAYATPNLEVKVDNAAPTISSVSATTIANQPACNKVTVSISGATDANAGLATNAYSFDGGSTWQAASSKDFNTTALNLLANQIKVQDSIGNIYTYPSGVNGTAESCACALPWGGTLTSGSQVAAYLTASPMYPTACVSEQRTCNNGVLSGSYSNQACVQQYTYSWQTSTSGSCSASPSWSGWSACSKTCGGGTQTRSCLNSTGTQNLTVWCQRNDGSTVSDSYCTTAKPSNVQSCYVGCSGVSSQSCNTQACPPTTCGGPSAYSTCTGNFQTHGWAADDPRANGLNSFSSTWSACTAVCGSYQARCTRLIDYGLMSNAYNCMCYSDNGVAGDTGSFAPGNSNGWESNAANCN